MAAGLRITSIPSKKNSWFIRFMSSWLKNLNITGWLIILNILFFIIQLISGFFNSPDCTQTICKYLAIQPNNLFLNNYYWTLLTSMFSHGGFMHLFVNMFSLYFIGNFLEMIIGKKRFFWLYLISGLFAGLFFAFFAFVFGNWGVLANIFGNSQTFALGASGAIFGIAGVLAFLTPRNKVYLIAGPIVAIVLQSLVEILSNNNAGISTALDFILSIYIFVCIFSLLSFNPSFRKISLPIQMPFWLLPIVAIIPLVIIGLFVVLPIGNMAHLGGLICGAIYGLFLRLKYKKKTQIISNYFSR